MTFGGMIPDVVAVLGAGIVFSPARIQAQAGVGQRFGASGAWVHATLQGVGRLDPRTHVDKRHDFFCSCQFWGCTWRSSIDDPGREKKIEDSSSDHK